MHRAALLALIVAAPALAAGCLTPDLPTDGAQAQAPEHFTRAGAPPVGFHWYPLCGGPCYGTELFAVFENGRAIKVRHDVQAGAGGGNVTLAEGVDYSREELATLFAPLLDSGEVVNVTEVRRGVVPPSDLAALRDALNGSWTDHPGEWKYPENCVDCVGPGTFAKRLPNGTFDVVESPNATRFDAVIRAFNRAEAAFQPAPLPPPGPPHATVEVVARDDPDAGAWWFEWRVAGNGSAVSAEAGRNPTVRMTPGAHVTVNFINLGSREHTLDLGAPVGANTTLVPPGENAVLEFAVPGNATGEARYWCAPHRSLGMEGGLVLAPPGTG